MHFLIRLIYYFLEFGIKFAVIVCPDYLKKISFSSINRMLTIVILELFQKIDIVVIYDYEDLYRYFC